MSGNKIKYKTRNPPSSLKKTSAKSWNMDFLESSQVKDSKTAQIQDIYINTVELFMFSSKLYAYVNWVFCILLFWRLLALIWMRVVPHVERRPNILGHKRETATMRVKLLWNNSQAFICTIRSVHEQQFAGLWRPVCTSSPNVHQKKSP